MSRTSALGAVYASIVEEFAADTSGTAVVFGKREPPKIVNQGQGRANRVVVEPYQGQNAGTLAPARFPGGNPKCVGTFLASPTLYLWAVDLTKPNDELAQYEAVTALLERVVTAIQTVAGGAYTLGQVQNATTKTERVFGAEWSVSLELRENLFGLPDPVAIDVSDETTYELDAPPGP